MKISLVCVGIMREKPLMELAEKYIGRIPYYMPFEVVAVPDIKASKGLTTELQKEREGEAILAKIDKGDFVILLDERGRELTSRGLSELIVKKANTISRRLIFVIGGPYGFSEAVYTRADMQLALSKMTFTHEMARVLTLEQIYRAMTIWKGEPYHHD